MVKKLFIILFLGTLMACNQAPKKEKGEAEKLVLSDIKEENNDIDNRLEKYVNVKLTSDLSGLSENQKKMIPLLIEVGKVMDKLFWQQAYGDKSELMNAITDEKVKRFAEINYGPWDRLEGNEPFVEGFGEKALGANFYPKEMTKAEFEKADLPNKKGLYTILRKGENGVLKTIPYHKAYESEMKQAADLLRQAAKLADNAALKKYLNLRAEAFLTDDYRASDLAWMDMKDNQIDIICGPIETYEDQLFGYKASYEAYVLVKDLEWSKKLEKYVSILPELQKNLPVEDKYKTEEPGTDSQLAAYDVVYYAGDCNAGSKTIAVNLPNDETVQLEKGTRRSQLKNAMRAKFDQILVPISKMLITPAQQKYINFDAFFANTMFHEVAHGLGIKNTINNKGTVREALKEHASALEEGKADVLGLFMVTQLYDKGEIDGDIKDYYTTFMASIFRSVRFGASSAHGKANMIRFTFFKDAGVISRDAQGFYTINYDKMKNAMDALTSLIIEYQGNGDYEGVSKLVNEKAIIDQQLQEDLDRLTDAGIPVDVVFKQGVEVLGLEVGK